jgi:hypothetical protein
MILDYWVKYAGCGNHKHHGMWDSSMVHGARKNVISFEIISEAVHDSSRL